MTEKEYQQELMRLVGLFSHDIVEVVHSRIETYVKENNVCERCG